MRQYKIVAGILLILPITNFVFALPTAVQETHQLSRDVVPDDAITMSAKRGDEMKKQWDIHSESFSGELESSLDVRHPSVSARLESDGPTNGDAPPQSPTSSTAPDHGSMDPLQMGTSEIGQVSPGFMKSPSFHYLVKPESDGPINGDALPQSPTSSTAPDHGSMDPLQMGTSEIDQVSPGLMKSPPFHYLGVKPESSASSTPVDSNNHPVSISPMKSPKCNPFLKKIFSKLKFWRRISWACPGSVRDVVNVAQGVARSG